MKHQAKTLTLVVILVLLNFPLSSLSSWRNVGLSYQHQLSENSPTLFSIAHPYEVQTIDQGYYSNELDDTSNTGFSHDGQYFYVLDHQEDSIAVWQTEARKFLFKRSVEGFHCKSSVMEHLSGIGFSPDSQWIIAFDHKKETAKAWALPEGNEVDISGWSTSAIYGAVFAHDVFPTDGDHLLLFGYYDLMHLISFNQLLRLTKDETEFSEWTLFREPGDYVVQGFQLDEGDQYERAALSPDGRHTVFASTDGYLIRFNCETGQVEGSTQEIDYSVAGLSYTPDGTHIIAFNKRNGVVIYDEKLHQQIDSKTFEFVNLQRAIRPSASRN